MEGKELQGLPGKTKYTGCFTADLWKDVKYICSRRCQINTFIIRKEHDWLITITEQTEICKCSRFQNIHHGITLAPTDL